MPIYEYKCKACGSEFEYQQRMSEPPKKVCESCSGELEKLISRSSFMLKGSGWYKDLYSSPKPASSDTKSESSDSGSGKSDSSPSASGSSGSSSSSGDSGSSSASSGSGSSSSSSSDKAGSSS